MHKIKIIIGVGFLFVVLAGALFYTLRRGFITIPWKEAKPIVVSGEGLIVYRSTGFYPSRLVIKKGTRITFVNSSQESVYPMWVGSDLHPTHSRYTGSSIDKCGTPEEPKIFDSCRNVPPGSVWSFTFEELGLWGYHNHLSPGHVGTILVAE